MSDFEVKMPDFEELFERQIGREVEKAVGQIVNAGLRTAQRTRSFQDRTGQLRASGEAGVEGSFASGKLEGYVRFSGPSAEFIEEGTKPHVITPVNVAFLHWKGQAQVGRGPGGRFTKAVSADHFARIVHHPGTKATHFVRDCIDPEKAAARIGKAVERGSK